MTMMSSTSDKKSNFFFENCLQCEGIIRIPITIRPDSSVGCPHCSKQFDVYALLEHIPEVSVEEGVEAGLSDSGNEFQIDTGSSTEQLDGKFVVPPQLAAGMRKRRRRRRRRSGESAGSRESSRSQSSSTSSPMEPGNPNRQLSEAEELRLARQQERAQKEREKLQQQREAAAQRNAGQRGQSGGSKSTRRKEPKRSPVVEASKIIIGGLLAAPIAYLLLMWVFSRDPLGLRGSINQYAPVLLPPSMVMDDEGDTTPKTEIGSGDSISSMLPVPETDPDDVDVNDSDLDLKIFK